MANAVPGPHDAQRVILRGVNLDFARYFSLTILDVEAAKKFVATLAVDIGKQGNASALHIAVGFTFNGLAVLDVPSEILDRTRTLAKPFVKGAALSAARVGDIGPNGRQHWDAAFTRDAHVLLSLYADDDTKIDEKLLEWQKTGEAFPGGMMGWEDPLSGRHLGDKRARREPFGFRDGLSQPTLEGIDTGEAEASLARLHVNPGEILLGYKNDDPSDRWSEQAIGTEAFRFYKNGSFAAFRKMKQNVDAFKELPLHHRAKVCGRWPNGEVVQPGQIQEPSAAGASNDFDFASDPSGFGCPFASHIRRMNPRGDPVTLTRKRVLMRRGIPYRKTVSNSVEEGLLGLFFCADIEKQFEFLLSDWARVAPMDRAQDPVPDPVMGLQDKPAAAFVMPDPKQTQSIHLQSFVATKGTMYAFYPSKTALGIIGSGT